MSDLIADLTDLHCRYGSSRNSAELELVTVELLVTFNRCWPELRARLLAAETEAKAANLRASRAASEVAAWNNKRADAERRALAAETERDEATSLLIEADATLTRLIEEGFGASHVDWLLGRRSRLREWLSVHRVAGKGNE